MGSFAQQLAAFEAKTVNKLDLAVRKISLEMFSKLVLRSPVDTGRFRANWGVAIGSMNTGSIELDDKSGTATISRNQAEILGVQAGDVITLGNSLPYGPKLEDGSSQQAPAGMVSLTVQEFQTIVRKVGLELVVI